MWRVAVAVAPEKLTGSLRFLVEQEVTSRQVVEVQATDRVGDHVRGDIV